MSDNDGFEVREFAVEDYDGAFGLWSQTEGLSLNEADSREGVTAFLQRNPGFSAIATNDAGKVVGAVLCGHNGRAGFLYHLAVGTEFRRRGLGRRLVEFCFEKLAEARIPRCNIFVYTDNEVGNRFWLNHGWKDPVTWKVLQKPVSIAFSAPSTAGKRSY